VRLVKYDHATRQEIHSAMADGDPVTGNKIIDVVISRLRRKLAPHSIKIATIWGLGFRLAEDSRDRIRKLLAAYGADIVAAATPPAADRKKAKPEAA
jgi:hypothetical protein